MLLQQSTSKEPDVEAPLISRNTYGIGLENDHEHVELKDPTQNVMEEVNSQSSVSRNRKRSLILQQVGCTRANQLTPAARKLHHIVRYWSQKKVYIVSGSSL